MSLTKDTVGPVSDNVFPNSITSDIKISFFAISILCSEFKF